MIFLQKTQPWIVEAIIKSAKRVVEDCIELGLKCLDPPATITPLLRCLGYNEYQARKFWAFFENLEKPLEVKIYKYLSIEFKLLIAHRKEIVMHLKKGCTPLDELDCRRLHKECIKTPHAHALYVFLEGRVEEDYIRLNIIRLLKLLYEKYPDKTRKILDILVEAAWDHRKINEVYSIILEILRTESELLKLIVPLIPLSINELVERSPILRRIHK